MNRYIGMCTSLKCWFKHPLLHKHLTQGIHIRCKFCIFQEKLSNFYTFKSHYAPHGKGLCKVINNKIILWTCCAALSTLCSTEQNIQISIMPAHKSFPYDIVSIRDARISLTMLLGCESRSLNTLSITESSVAVVSSPQNAVQSLTTKPAPTTSLPRFTVPATSGTCNSDDSSSRSSIDVCGCTWEHNTSHSYINPQPSNKTQASKYTLLRGENKP